MAQPSLEELLKQANALLAKQAAEENEDDNESKKDNVDPEKKHRAAAKSRADHLLNMKSTKGLLADYLAPATFGQGRAGRATQIAQSLGIEPGLTTKYPITTAMPLAGLGSGIGSAVGAIGGFPGVIAGGMLGSLGGLGLAGALRRSNMHRIRNKLERELALNNGENIQPQRPNFGVASSLLLPFAGNHRAGQADAYNALKDNTKYPSMLGRNTLNTANSVPYLGALTALPGGIVQNFNARSRTRDPEELALEAEAANMDGGAFQPRKAASALEFGVKLAARGDQMLKLMRQLAAADKAAPSGPGSWWGAAAAQSRRAGVSPGNALFNMKKTLGSGNFANKNMRFPVDGSYVPPRGSAQAANVANIMKATKNLPVTGAFPTGARDSYGGNIYKWAPVIDKLKNMPVGQPGMIKTQSAGEFGQKLANIDPKLYGGLGGAAALGLGGAALGAMNPGEEETVDDNGRVVKRQKSRLMGALKGLGLGAAAGAAGGALAGHYYPGQVTHMGQAYNRMTPLPTREVANARQAMNSAGEEPFTDPLLGDNAAMTAAQGG